MPFQNPFPNFGMAGNRAPQAPPANHQWTAPIGQPANSAPRMPSTAVMAAGMPKQLPAPTIRLQGPEAPTTTASRLVLPMPEELGIRAGASQPVAATQAPRSPASPNMPPTSGTAAVASIVDWNAVHARLARLGAVEFHLGRQGQAHRVTFLLPTGDQSRFRQVEASDADQCQAIGAALQQAEIWAQK